MLKQFAILTLLCSWATIFAQEPIRYTTKQGLPSNHVYDMAEDADGFMWFATKQGLVKYDGETFKTLTVKDGLPNNDTWLLEPDLHGRLWYFSKSAYQGYIKNDSIYKFSTREKEVITPQFIYKTKDSLWFGGTSGVQKFNANYIINAGLSNKDNVEAFSEKSYAIQREHGFDLDRLMPTLINPKTKAYIYLSDNKILIYDWDLKFKKEIPTKIPIEYTEPNISNNGLIYNQIGFFAMGKGVLFIDFKNDTATFKSFNEMIGVNQVKYFRCRVLENEFQISVPGHLIVFDYNLKVKETYNFNNELSQSSYKDSKGNIWLTDLANGLSLLPSTQTQAHYYLQDHKVQKINSIKDDFYAGVNDKGFYKLNENLNVFEPLNQFTRANAEVYQIKEDVISNKAYFISLNKNYSLNGSNFEILKIRTIKEYNGINFFMPGIKDITNYKGSSYIASSNYLIKSSNPKELSLKIAVKSGLLFTEVYKDKIYIAGSDGLHQVINDSLVKPQLKHALLDVSISSITSSKDYLLVGTDGRGIYLYNENALFHIKATDGLSIQKIIKQENSLWLATQKGVKKIDLNQHNLSDSKLVDAYYEADGLLQNNTNDIYIKNDVLYAASDIGLVKLNVSDSIYKQAPKLYFKPSNDTLSYKNGERDNIALSFALQNYVNQEHTSYQYRLLPNQQEWTTTTTKTINFYNLSPDLYTLEVKATDQHNNTSVIKQHLNVIPAWWQTWYNKIGFVFIGLFGVLLLWSKMKQKIKEIEQDKAQKEKRVAGLELQALRSQMNPHFVHNSLNAIQYFIQRKEVELSENYLSKFSQLIRLFFEYSRRQTITIKEELELLTNYLDIEKLRFEEKLEYTITVCEKIDVEEQQIPSMLLQPIVENAVNHGLFHKKSNGTVSIDFKQISESTFQVIVKDDGIGINKAKALFKASSKNYQSNSSAVLLERLDLLNKSNQWQIDYNIQDISEIEKDNTGTIATLIFRELSNE